MLSYPGNRRDVFRMIEAIRSSSPANTPGGLGFDTPVHLRRQHGSQSAFGFPLTPTLAPTENEDGFIGSSPTPATRDPTPALHSDAPVLRTQDIAMTDASDLPSSPPQIASRSPSPRKQARNARRRSLARAKKAKAREAAAAATSAELSTVSSPAISVVEASQDTTDVPEQPKENTSASQVDDRPPSRRTRSALSQSTENDQNWTSAPAIGTPTKPIEASAGLSSKPKSASRKKPRKAVAKKVDGDDSQQDQSEELPDALPIPVVTDHIDSGDDLDVQIASQLSQDLGLALDQGSQHEARSAEPTASAASQSSKKRKRSEENGTPMAANGRRRSTRLSTAKDAVTIDPDDPDATQSQEGDIDLTDQASFPAIPPAPTPRRSTRSSQRQEESVTSESLSPVVVRGAPHEHAEDSETSQPPPKRTRKSARGEDKASAGVVSPAQSQSSYSTRSGRTRSSQNKNQQSPLLLGSTAPEPSSNQPEMLGVKALLQVINPTLETGVNLDVPLVSTEEATLSQGTDSDLLPASISQDTNIHMDVDAVEPSDGIPVHAAVHVAPTATTAIQPEYVPTSGPDTSETRITNSLKRVLENIKEATLSLNALREIDDLLFNIRVEAHDASRRHNHTA